MTSMTISQVDDRLTTLPVVRRGRRATGGSRHTSDEWLIKNFIKEFPKSSLMTRGHITIIGKATSDSESLRTTIPMGIVKQLDLKEGGKLSWRIEAKNSALIVVVEPIKPEANKDGNKRTECSNEG